MIQPSPAPREPRGRGLRALRVSLNSPVVAHASLPTGPAAAAVALDAQGALVCVRSIRTGQTAFFGSAEELAATPRLALDAALSFAEGMGFLFDEDEVALRGDEAAQRLWHAHCGDPAAQLEETWLEQAGDAAPCPAELVRASAADARSLSKFRFLADRA